MSSESGDFHLRLCHKLSHLLDFPHSLYCSIFQEFLRFRNFTHRLCKRWFENSGHFHQYIVLPHNLEVFTSILGL
ncbi:hypothetical protein RIR_jg39564.t1 [Rhizophagus irregularis DAOM 181602=DAOM 197198]|nr:hypothetical protein RIR_jg39564.t1 [Rhizophagus irregularis DAOM 181602=DAOM 197198]